MDFKVNMLFLFKQNKAKKKKKGVVPGGGLKATMKDDLADYGGYDGEYVQDFEDFCDTYLSFYCLSVAHNPLNM